MSTTAALLALLVASGPPCGDASVRPASCAVPSSWLCLSPQFAASAEAERLQQRDLCEAEKLAQRAEADTVLRRERGKLQAERDALEARLDIALGVAADAEWAAKAAEAEANRRWTTWEVTGLVVGVAVGAAAAAGLGVWLGTR